MNSFLKIIFIMVFILFQSLFGIFQCDIRAISSFLVYQSYVTVRPNHKIKSFTLTISKEQEKIKKFHNIFDKKIHFTLLKCSEYKQPFKSISWSNSGRILSGRSKNNSNGSIFYILVNY